jgi:subtilisin family serine protease
VAAKRRHEPARKAAAPPARKAASAPVRRAAPPPIRAVQDNRYAPDEVLFELRPDASPAQAGRIARRLRLTILDRSRIELLSTELVRARIPRGSSVPATIRALRAQQVAAAQPNFRYRLQDAAAPATKDDAGVAGIPPADLASAQYTPGKLNLSDAHAIARGRAVLVAVIDSGVDASHPELDGSVAEPVPGKGHVHGTGMAGAIAAHARLVGIAPDVRILDLPAFATAADSGTGLTMEIATALDGAFRHKAQIVNMSFAGPQDDLIQRAVRALNRNGTVLIAAAGNAGPNSPPLYPAAYREVIAVTATDDQDRLYRMANRGGHIGAAAPGVDILVPAPGGGYHQLSGTSLAAAHVTGLAALLIEVRPGLKPDDLRDTLTRTARDLGAPGRDDLFGAGLVDARAAVNALRATALGPEN